AWLVWHRLFRAHNADAVTFSGAFFAKEWYLGVLTAALFWVGLVSGRLKLAGMPLFAPGMINVVNSAASDLGTPYAFSPPPTPTPSASPTPSPAESPSPGEPPSPSASPSP